MEINKEEWLGVWENFENYFEDQEPSMVLAWQQAQASLKNDLKTKLMFPKGAKSFWQKACKTAMPYQPKVLGGWLVKEGSVTDSLNIDWLDTQNNSLGCKDYVIDEILPKGLEGKPNIIFKALDSDNDFPFNYLLAMEPFPSHQQAKQEGYLTHLHFQYAASKDKLVKKGKLCHPWWYATMCDGSGTPIQRSNVVRALHKVDKIME